MNRKASFQTGHVHWWQLLLLAGTILLPACSGSLEDHPPLYPVKGKVTRNGKPMTGGTIIFEYAGEAADAPKGVGGGPFRATAKINVVPLTLLATRAPKGCPRETTRLASRHRSDEARVVFSAENWCCRRKGNLPSRLIRMPIQKPRG